MAHVVLVLALFLAGCAMTPPDTSLNRVYASLHHIDHPEYGRPISQAERRPDFTGTHPAPSQAAVAAWKADVNACADETERQPRDPELSITEHTRRLTRRMWDCLWARGWRWDRD